MLTVEYNDIFDFSAASVFSLLTDLENRAKWITGILEVRVTPPGPAHLNTTYFESGKFSGYKSEKTMVVTEFEQDHLFTLSTPAEVRNSFRENYRIEPVSAESCRVFFTVEVGGAPKVAEFFMQQAMKKALPQQAASLKSILANQLHKAS